MLYQAGEVINICSKGKIQQSTYFLNIEQQTQMFCFLGRPGEPEGLPERAEQRAAHCCGQKRQVRS